MSQIIDWEYYSSHFPQVVPEAQFAAVEQQAEAEFNRVVKPYMEVPEGRQKETVFQLCNFLYTNRAGLSGKSVKSVSNNGYSESYAVSGRDELAGSIRELIYEYADIRLAGAF
jgi:hypothetical protein